MRNEYSIRAECVFHGFDGDRPGAVGLEIGHVIAAALKLFCAFAYRVMFDGGCDYVIAAAAHRFGTAEECPVIALRAAGSEDKL